MVKPAFTALQIKKLSTPGTYAVGKPPGLVLRVRESSSAQPDGSVLKQWALRYMLGGKSRMMGLGSYPDVSLEDARKLAQEIRTQQIKLRGIDPLAEKATRKEQARQAEQLQARRKTFDQCAAEYIETHGVAWKNAKHRAQWENTLRTYVSPVFGHLPVDQVTKAHVLDVLRPIWQTKNETAMRLRGRIESIFYAAQAQGSMHGENPAVWAGNLKELLPAVSRKRRIRHHPALPHSEIPRFYADLGVQSGVAASALRFLILTASRTGEVTGATWEEIDLRSKQWTIPASRMKAGKEQRVPLSPPAIELLQSLDGREGPLFRSPKGKALSDMAMLALLKRMGRSDLTTHGFRSSFRDWAGECTHHAREVIEHALAHGLKDQTEAAYARGTLMAKRRALMCDWSDFCLAQQTARI
jgi:integrase